MIRFFIATDTIPRTSSQEKGCRVVRGRPKFYTKQKVQDAKQFYSISLKMHRLAEPIKGAIDLTINFFYPVRKPHKDGEPKTTRGDLDNMAKGFIDVMTSLGFWEDDAQIVRLHLTKSYCSPSGIMVTIKRINKQGNEVIE